MCLVKGAIIGSLLSQAAIFMTRIARDLSAWGGHGRALAPGLASSGGAMERQALASGIHSPMVLRAVAPSAVEGGRAPLGQSPHGAPRIPHGFPHARLEPVLALWVDGRPRRQGRHPQAPCDTRTPPSAQAVQALPHALLTLRGACRPQGYISVYKFTLSKFPMRPA